MKIKKAMYDNPYLCIFYLVASRPAAHMDGVHLSGRPVLKERKIRWTREKWSQDNILIKVQMFNGRHAL